MDDFTKYETLREKGSNPREVYELARADGLDVISSIRLLRRVFGLSLVDAKKDQRDAGPIRCEAKTGARRHSLLGGFGDRRRLLYHGSPRHGGGRWPSTS